MNKPKLNFRRDSADYLLARYLGVTCLRFDKEMGLRLVQFRKTVGVTQRQLAEQLGLNQTDIARLEKGKNIAAAPNAERFKTVLDKYFDDVVFGGPFLELDRLTKEYDKQTRKWWGSFKR